jgi:cold shock CspA family protein
MRGFVNEDLIVAKLEQRCDIKRDPVYDHKYKLDFIVNGFKKIDRLVHIGVQVTTNPNDAEKQAIFLKERRKHTLVERSLYVKLSPEVDVQNVGAELVYNAIVSFAFQQRLRSKDIMGVLIHADATYDFFELRDAVASAPRPPVQHQDRPPVRRQMPPQPMPHSGYPQQQRPVRNAPGGYPGREYGAPQQPYGASRYASPTGAPKPDQQAVRPQLKGEIVRYFPYPKGYGFVSNEQGTWFFHISEVADTTLREQILPSVEIDLENRTLVKSIPVSFTDAGYTRPNADKPTAMGLTRTEQGMSSAYEGLPVGVDEEIEALEKGSATAAEHDAPEDVAEDTRAIDRHMDPGSEPAEDDE